MIRESFEEIEARLMPKTLSEEGISVAQGRGIRSTVTEINKWLGHCQYKTDATLLRLLKVLTEQLGIHWTVSEEEFAFSS